MKILTKATLLALGLAVAAAPILAAKVDRAESGPRKASLRALVERRTQVRAHVAKRLELSPEQASQLKAKRAETRNALKSLRADATLSREQKREKARALLKGTRGELRALLSPDQQHKLDRAQQRHRERLKERRRG
jgi:hypothetical protein